MIAQACDHEETRLIRAIPVSDNICGLFKSSFTTWGYGSVSMLGQERRIVPAAEVAGVIGRSRAAASLEAPPGI